jgi:hypothetical protein
VSSFRGEHYSDVRNPIPKDPIASHAKISTGLLAMIDFDTGMVFGTFATARRQRVTAHEGMKALAARRNLSIGPAQNLQNRKRITVYVPYGVYYGIKIYPADIRFT